ncbi:hypothetical protein KIH32_25985 [Pseudomonas fluorescens]|uniref:hypothetical protein n=1 Tax=Pseudomonas fluorescens TaxID=294 RepID=UPI000F6DAB4A|nr:hypothetical protein [Pseudomonas fluorescens]AZF61169.1 hypothetical protein C4J83_0147 [Pseudomonas sp. LBUM920]MBT0627369.1 hypothetical protein [Pseudomonas fluorescens]
MVGSYEDHSCESSPGASQANNRVTHRRAINEVVNPLSGFEGIGPQQALRACT